MSRKNPKGKGAATVTARMLDAIAADLRNTAAGFESAASLYRLGSNQAAKEYADLSFRHGLSFLRIWKDAR